MQLAFIGPITTPWPLLGSYSMIVFWKLIKMYESGRDAMGLRNRLARRVASMRTYGTIEVVLAVC